MHGSAVRAAEPAGPGRRDGRTAQGIPAQCPVLPWQLRPRIRRTSRQGKLKFYTSPPLTGYKHIPY
jgi:hypothetical protein